MKELFGNRLVAERAFLRDMKFTFTPNFSPHRFRDLFGIHPHRSAGCLLLVPTILLSVFFDAMWRFQWVFAAEAGTR